LTYLVCGLPSEYCEFGKKFADCKEWMKVHKPEEFLKYEFVAAKPQVEKQKASIQAESEEAGKKQRKDSKSI